MICIYISYYRRLILFLFVHFGPFRLPRFGTLMDSKKKDVDSSQKSTDSHGKIKWKPAGFFP